MAAYSVVDDRRGFVEDPVVDQKHLCPRRRRASKISNDEETPHASPTSRAPATWQTAYRPVDRVRVEIEQLARERENFVPTGHGPTI